jgi:hypothetical protein
LTAGGGKFGFHTFLAFIDRVQELGANVVLMDETATTEREQRFNLVTGLLVNDGDDMVGTEQVSAITPPGYLHDFDVDLGDALGDRYRWQGVLRRDFTGGTVLLNEPRDAEATVQLDRELLGPDGAVVSSLTLGPAEAAILTVAGS